MRGLAICLVLEALWAGGVLAQTIPAPAGLEAKLQAAAPGDVLDLGVTSISAPYLNAGSGELLTSGGHLLYSDDPETALATGILYRDSLPAGAHRVYLYHVNGMASSRKFSIVLENEGGAPASIAVTRKSLAGPSYNYVQAGKSGVQMFYENTSLPAPFSIPAGGRALLDAAIETQVAFTNQLVAAIYEYTTDQPLRVSTVMLTTATDTLAAYSSLGFAANDGFERQGTFFGFTREDAAPYNYSTALGVRKIRVASPRTNETDPPLTGTDAERDNAATILRGNYGVTYEIDLSVSTPNGRMLAVLLNPRGGGYGGYFRTTFGEGAPLGQMVPAAQAVIPWVDMAGVGVIVSPRAQAQNLRLEFIPAGASSLPIEILLVPFPPGVKGEQWTMR